MKKVGITCEVVYRAYFEREFTDGDYAMLRHGDIAPLYEQDIIRDTENHGNLELDYTMVDLETGKTIVDWR